MLPVNPVLGRENSLNKTWVRDELVATEKFLNGWAIINKRVKGR